MNNIIRVVIGLVFLNSCASQSESNNQNRMDEISIFVGTYTRKEGHVDGKAGGIYRLKQKPENGDIALTESVTELINPSFLAITSNKKFLYAVSELGDRDGITGYLYAYSILADNSLKFINKQPTDALAPCHVSVDAKGKFVFVANYMGGVVKMYSVREDGSLSPSDMVTLKGSGTHPRQEGSHAHMVSVSPENKFLMIPDLGTDKIWIFKIDEAGRQLRTNDNMPFLKLQSGAGPRHMEFHPGGKYAFVINELDQTVNTLKYESETGELTNIKSISTIPEDFKDFNGTAAIHVHPNGKYVYGSNRGHDSIVIYSFDDTKGTLSLVGYESTRGEFPRSFIIDPSGKYLYVANQNTDNIVKFNIDPNTGLLTFDNEILVKTPVCLKILPQ